MTEGAVPPPSLIERMKPLLRDRSLAYSAILGIALLAHGLRLLNDGVYWDAWILHSKLVEGDWAAITEWYDEVGLPAIPYMYRLATIVGGPIVGLSLATFGSLLGAAVCVYELGRETGWISRRESTWVALLSLAYPAFQASVSTVVLPYLACCFLFLLGFLLAFRAERQDGWRHWALRVSALLLLAVSLTTNSLLVFYFGLFPLLLLHAFRVKQLPLLPVRRLAGVLARRLDYLVMPFAFWLAQRTVFMPHGDYQSYHSFDLAPYGLYTRCRKYLELGLREQLEAAASQILAHPIAALGVVGLALGVYWRFGADRERAPGHARTLPLILFGLMLLVMGIFPYAAIGELPTLRGWWTRHLLLVGLPAALIILACVRLLLSSGRAVLSVPAHVALMLLLAGFTSMSVRTYVDWQARWVKDRAFIQKISNNREAVEKFSLFWIEDRFPLGGQNTYAYYEWTTMLETAFGNEAHFGMDWRSRSPAFKVSDLKLRARRENFTEVDPAGAEVRVLLTRGRGAGSSWDMSRTYLYYRYLAPKRLPEYLDSVIALRLSPLAPPPAPTPALAPAATSAN